MGERKLDKASKHIEGIDSCLSVWEYQDQNGFVCVSSRDGKDWQDYTFSWPEEKGSIKSWFKQKVDKGIDLYWSPMIYKAKKRRIELVKPSRVLYADLDNVDPRKLNLKPSVAWASSDKRFQCIWLLESSLDLETFNSLNKALTYNIGADKGGWDATQVLRIPGTYNYKYSPSQKGRTLWAKWSSPYDQDVFDLAPEKSDEGSYRPSKTLVELLSKYREVIPHKTSRLLQYPPTRVDEGNRSDVLWSIESTLVEARIPIEDIVDIIFQTSWNKYKGRRDEYKRVFTEVSKVYQGKQQDIEPKKTEPEQGRDRTNRVDEPEEGRVLRWQSYDELMSNGRSSPGWLIDKIWLDQSHGIVAGEPKTFKSTVVLDMAISVASGKSLWGEFEVHNPGPVIIVQNENSNWIMKDRIEKIIKHKGLAGSVEEINDRELNVEFPPTLPIEFLNNEGYNFADPLDRELFEEFIAEVEPVLVVFDPLYLMFDGDLNSAQDLGPVLRWLLGLKEHYRTAVMVIHHWNKNGANSRGGQRMLGSTTLHGWTESALYMGRLEEDKAGHILIEREFRASGNPGKLELSIEMGDLGVPLYNPCIKKAEASDRIALLDLLSMHPTGLSVRQLAKELNVSRASVNKLIEESKEYVETEKGPGKGLSMTVRLKTK